MCAETFNFTCYKIPCYDSLGLTVDKHKVKHFMTRIAFYCTGGNLTVQCCVCSEKKLLTGLSAGIESTAYLSTSERTV